MAAPAAMLWLLATATLPHAGAQETRHAVAATAATDSVPTDSVSQKIVTADSAADSVPSDSVPSDSTSKKIVTAESAAVLPVPKSTPVDIDREAPAPPPLHYYDRHGEPLETPVRFLAELDTVTRAKSGPVYPAFCGVSVGANFFDAVMMLIGQQRASFDVWADCSIHNWLFPVVEAGVGFADAHPDDGRCHFKMKPTLYARIGLNYNFLYKSNPDYQFFIGLRAGWSTFGYDIYDIQAGSQYYIQDGPANVAGLRSTAFYGQALAGLKVHIWRRLFMGWSVRYNFGIHQSYSDDTYPAWFTPGKGTSTPIAATFSIGWTFGPDPKPRLPKDLQEQ